MAGATTELESMVVRLLGDGSSYQRMMKEATEATSRAEKAVVASTAHIEKAQSMLNRFAEGAKTWGQSLAIAGQSLTMAITAPLKQFGRESLHAFSAAEDGLLKLKAAVGANGHDVESTMKQYEKFADTMQDLTRKDDDAVLSLLQVAETMGLTGEKAMRAAQNAIAMEGSGRGQASGNIRLTAGLEMGSADRLKRMFPELRGIKDKSEQVAKAQELMAKAFEVAKASAGSTAGRLEQMGNHIENLKETIGEVIAEAVVPFVEVVRDIAKALKEADPTIRKTLVIMGVVAAAIGPALAIIGGLIPVLGAGIAIVTNFWVVIGAGVAAAVVGVLTWIGAWDKLWNAVKGFTMKAAGFLANFKDNMTRIVSWLKENWLKLTQDLAIAFLTFLSNMVVNAGVILQTMGKLFLNITGYIVGLFEQLFTVDFQVWLWTGIKQALGGLMEFATRAWEVLQSTFTGKPPSVDDFMDGVIAEIEKGRRAQDIGVVLSETIAAGFAKTKSPLDGMKWTVDGLQLAETVKEEVGYAKAPIKDLKNAMEDALGVGDNEAVRKGSAQFRKQIQESAQTLIKASKAKAAVAEAEQRQINNNRKWRAKMIDKAVNFPDVPALPHTGQSFFGGAMPGATQGLWSQAEAAEPYDWEADPLGMNPRAASGVPALWPTGEDDDIGATLESLDDGGGFADDYFKSASKDTELFKKMADALMTIKDKKGMEIALTEVA